MSKDNKKSRLNRKDTQTLLSALKVATITGVASLTIAGWGILSHIDASKISQAIAAEENAVVAMLPLDDKSIQVTPAPKPEATATNQIVNKLDVVRWGQTRTGQEVAVVRDAQGSLWNVMVSDVDRIERGLAPLTQPQLAQRVTTRSRGS